MCMGQIDYGPSGAGLCSSCPVEYTGKQLSAFIRKVEIFASEYVGLIYYWICLPDTIVVFPSLELICVFLKVVVAQDLGK